MDGPVPVAWVGCRSARRGRAAEAGARQIAARAETRAPAIAIGAGGLWPRGSRTSRRSAKRTRQGSSRAGVRGASEGALRGIEAKVGGCPSAGARLANNQAVPTSSSRAAIDFFAFRGPVAGRRCEPHRRAPSEAPRAANKAVQRRGPCSAWSRWCSTSASALAMVGARPSEAGFSWGAAVLGPLCGCSCRLHAATGARRSKPGPASQSTRSGAAPSSLRRLGHRTAALTRQPFGLRPLSPTARQGSARDAAIMARAPAAPDSAVRTFGPSLNPCRTSGVAR